MKRIRLASPSSSHSCPLSTLSTLRERQAQQRANMRLITLPLYRTSPIRLSSSLSWQLQQGFISNYSPPSTLPPMSAEDSMLLEAPQSFTHFSLGLHSVTRDIMVLVITSLSCLSLGWRQESQAGLRLTSSRCTFSAASMSRSKPNSSKHPSWYLMCVERMASVIMWSTCWLYLLLRSPKASPKKSSSIMIDAPPLLYTDLKMLQLVRCTSLLSLAVLQGSWANLQQAVWYLQMMGLFLKAVTSTHCLMSNFLLAKRGVLVSRYGWGRQCCMILFSYFFLFLNSLHRFQGLVQYSLLALAREMPAPLELAMGLMIQMYV